MALRPEGIGTNQLNIYLFEVGYKKQLRNPVTGTLLPERTFFAGVHPLLVAPQRIQYEDMTRSPVLQTTGGSVETKAGRALRTVSMEGSFGVEARGLGPYIGTGEIRFKRFYKEVVRMSDAMFDSEVDDLVNALGDPSLAGALIQGALSGSTPGIQAMVAPFDEKDSTFYVNFYDFWNGLAFQVQIAQFSAWREHRNGGATGLVHYRMQLKEVGPIVTGGLASTIINGLLTGMSFWSGVNEAVKSYTVGNIAQSFTNLAGPFILLTENTRDAFNDQIDSARQLMGGKAGTGSSTKSGGQSVSGTSTSQTTTSSSTATTSGGASAMATLEAQQTIASYFPTAERLAAAASTTALDIASQVSAFDSETGQIDYADQLAEGGSDDLARWDELVQMLDFEESVRFQPVVGTLFGMDRETYRAYIEAGGASSSSAPEISGTVPYLVSDTDTPATIEEKFGGVSWQRILAANRLTPDEALYPGTLLQIPVLRPRGEPGIEGLPVFGSHVGRSAWGVDLAAELDGDGVDGDIMLVTEEDALRQGAEFIVDVFGEDLLKVVQDIPSQVRVAFMQRQLQQLFLSDERIESVEEVAVQVADTNLDVQVRLRAINGTTSISFGGL